MEIFPALGLAVLGVFVAIILSGILAGVVAFGLIDSAFRSTVQKEIIRNLVDKPLANSLRSSTAPPETKWWGLMSLEFLRNSPNDLASLVRLEPDRLFRLPYRQLCGQIANAVGAESYDVDEGADRPNRFHQPLTLALVLADFDSRGTKINRFDFSQAYAKTRALAFLDTIQIALADAVLAKARFFSTMVIVMIFLAILAPNLGALNIYATDQTDIARFTGALLAFVIAPILILTLAVAATIVAMLTFRWIDRFASAR